METIGRRSARRKGNYGVMMAWTVLATSPTASSTTFCPSAPSSPSPARASTSTPASASPASCRALAIHNCFHLHALRTLTIATCVRIHAPSLHNVLWEYNAITDKSVLQSLRMLREDEQYWESEIQARKSFLEHLKVVRIHGFLERENEISLAKFLLKHGKALQEMTLYTGYCNGKHSLRRQKIRSQMMGFSWASSNAKFAFQ